MLVLFSIQTKEGWFDPVMWSEVDGTQVDHQPREWSKPQYIVFAIGVNIITNLLFLNLFVGVVIETFKKQKDILVGKKMLTKKKLEWISVQIMGYEAKPVYKVTVTPEFSWLRRKVFALVTHRFWEPMI